MIASAVNEAINTSSSDEYVHRIRVEFEDVDAAGMVNSSKYFNYLERARVGLLESIDYPLQTMMTQDFFAVVARYEHDFVRPARFGVQILVRMNISELTRRHGIITYVMTSEDGKAIYARGLSKIVFVDSKGRPKMANDELSTKLSKFTPRQQ